ncbi:MAG: serine/threonine protein kinase [Acidobacteria bacterium]|nr:serine/threonine protein kinase [Acidobacteriota bacterium]
MDHIPSPPELMATLPSVTNVEFIASGGFKAVFKAEVNGESEAVKLVLLPELTEPDLRNQITARVEREVKVLENCKNPFLVKIGSLNLEEKTIGAHDYLVYSEELLVGESLLDVIEKGRSPNQDELIILARCLMTALDEIAMLGHIHRDVKPGNIIFTGETERPFVLLDLGIAFKMHGTELTAPGAGPPGTMIYMAPELFQPNYKDLLDIRSDIYSAGVTIFEYAAGSHPLARTGENPYATLYRIVKMSPPRLQTLRPDLEDWFCEMVNRCIKKTPALRYRNPKAFCEELEKQI